MPVSPAVQARVEAIRRLLESESRPLSITELMQRLGESHSKVYYAVRTGVKSGIFKTFKRGRRLYVALQTW